MVQISVDIVRKKAEHHDGLLAPLEEIALHQENIEKIEFIQDWCPKLKILLLQSNLIAKIENLNKLKHLQYLNLALNNIEVVENLDRCESLKKLDLTLNFIGNIVSIETLTNNYNLQCLYLTGNPCTDYDNYRDFVIGTLPQLMSLDGSEIDRSTRIKSLQNLPMIRSDILFEQNNYLCQRQKQKQRLQKDITEKWENEYKDMDPEERNKKFWAEKCEHAPEVRHEIERMRQLKLKSNEPEKQETKRTYKMFAPDGRPFNINQAKLDFRFDDSVPDKFILDIAVYKYLDSTLLETDVQPNYVRVTIKGKIFQLHLPEQVDTTNSTAHRSETTGHLVITMPKASYVVKGKMVPLAASKSSTVNKEFGSNIDQRYLGNIKREFLEIGPPDNILDFTKMTNNNKQIPSAIERIRQYEKEPSKEFVDNPEVPELI